MADTLPVSDVWYGIQPVAPGVTRLQEIHLHEYWSGSIWVIQGEALTVVADTGTGIVPLGPVVDGLCKGPVLAVALAHYYDHAGGLYSFADRGCHRLEAPNLTDPPDTTYNFRSEERLRAIPSKGYSFDDYVQKPAPPTRLFDDGDRINLGDRTLEVLHIPGRTEGSIALWDAAKGHLFAGETVFIDTDRTDFPPSDVAAYEDSLKRLSALPGTTVFGGHFGPADFDTFRDFVDGEIGRYRKVAPALVAASSSRPQPHHR